MHMPLLRTSTALLGQETTTRDSWAPRVTSELMLATLQVMGNGSPTVAFMPWVGLVRVRVSVPPDSAPAALRDLG